VPEPRQEPAWVLLDACSLLNLYATGHFERILRESDFRFAVVDYVMRTEALHVLKGGAGPDAGERVGVDLQPAVDAGLLAVVEVTGTAEAETFLDLAIHLDDGEARTLAISSNRGWAVATDDRKARRIAAIAAPEVPLWGTLELVKRWAERTGLSSTEIRDILLNIRERGNFVPGKQDTLLPWWHSVIGR